MSNKLPSDILERTIELFRVRSAPTNVGKFLDRAIAEEVLILLLELQAEREPKIPPPSEWVTADFLRALLKESQTTGDPEVDRISVSCSIDNMRRICQELLMRRKLDEIVEPAAWADITEGVIVSETTEVLKAELARVRELLKQQTHIAVLKGARAGDVVFVMPPEQASTQDLVGVREGMKELHKVTGISAVIMPPGFSVQAKDVTECVYTRIDDGSHEFSTSCGGRWFMPAGNAPYPFCVYCGHPTREGKQEPAGETIG